MRVQQAVNPEASIVQERGLGFSGLNGLGFSKVLALRKTGLCFVATRCWGVLIIGMAPERMQA